MTQEQQTKIEALDKWEVFIHTSPLGDTGDYNTEIGIKNGWMHLYCNDAAVDEEELQEVCNKLNNPGEYLPQGTNGVIIRKGEEVNALLVGAMRFLNEEQKIALRDALIERTPKAAQQPIPNWIDVKREFILEKYIDWMEENNRTDYNVLDSAFDFFTHFLNSRK